MRYLLAFTTVSLLLAAQSAAMAQVPPPLLPLIPGPPGPPPVVMPPPAPPPSEEYSIRYDDRHYHWCARRYRSYSAYDNSFQPNHGPRRQCYSPYN